jgi:hypothetical protein
MFESKFQIIKASGEKQQLNEEKLRSSLKRSGATDEAIEECLSHIENELHEGVTTAEIYKHAFDFLHRWKEPVAMRYALRRAVLALGPTGFPFEKFIAEYFRDKGFEAVTDQEVLGVCVPHEVDVVAWNNDKLIMAEAKFHNELGIKSDLKVALYIKARFDDLKANVFNYGGKDRKITDAWLITNTKFSSTAIHYGACQNLTMIGWNYPEHGNLQDMIESSPKLLEILKVKVN